MHSYGSYEKIVARQLLETNPPAASCRFMQLLSVSNLS